MRGKSLIAAALVAAGGLALAGCVIDSPFDVFLPDDGVKLSFNTENPDMVCILQNPQDPQDYSAVVMHFVLLESGAKGYEYALVSDQWTSVFHGPMHFHTAGDGLLIGATKEINGEKGESMFVVKQGESSLTFYDMNSDALDAIAAKHHTTNGVIGFYPGLVGGTADDHRQVMIEAAQSDLSKTATVFFRCVLAKDMSPKPVPDIIMPPDVPENLMPPDSPDTAAPAPEPDTAAPAPVTPAPDTAAPDSSKKN